MPDWQNHIVIDNNIPENINLVKYTIPKNSFWHYWCHTLAIQITNLIQHSCNLDITVLTCSKFSWNLYFVTFGVINEAQSLIESETPKLLGLSFHQFHFVAICFEIIQSDISSKDTLKLLFWTTSFGSAKIYIFPTTANTKVWNLQIPASSV